MLADDLGPRLYVEPIGQGDSDKPRNYRYSTVERADLVEALWQHHGVRRTVVVTFDYTSLALLELLRRQLERQPPPATTGRPVITAAFMVNGGLFADMHTHPWQGTPLLRTPLGALGMRRAQRSPRVFATSMIQARMYSHDYHPAPEELGELWSAVTRRDGAAFLHNAAGFVGRAPPPRATLGSRRDRPRPGRHGRPLRRRQRRGPLRAPPDRGRPRARAPSRSSDLPRRSPDHQRTPRPPRRRHPRHRGPPRRRHPAAAQPLTPSRTEGTHHDQHDQDDPAARAQRAVRPQLHPRALGLPAARVLVVTCLDHRVDPAIVLGLRLGDAPVIRNAGGRVTQAVVDDIAFLAFLTRRLIGDRAPTASSSKSRSSTTHNAEPAFSPTPASATRPPRPPASPKRRSKPPRSPTRTPPSRPTSSACSPRPRSHQE